MSSTVGRKLNSHYLVRAAPWLKVFFILLAALLGRRVFLRVLRSFLKSLIFLRWASWPRCDFEHPTKAVRIPGCGNLFLLEADRDVAKKHSIVRNLSCYPGIKNAKPHSIEGKANNRIGVWEMAAEKPRWNILYCHGNGGNRGTYHRTILYQVLNSLGITVYAFDYRGYGDSENAGKLDADGVADDAAAVLSWAREHCANGCPWALYGHSLGCGVVMHMLNKQKQLGDGEGEEDLELNTMNRLDAIVLEAPFTSIVDVVRDCYLFLLPRTIADWLLEVLVPSDSRFENIQLMPTCEIPTLILHGSADTVIPPSHGAALCSSRRDGKCEFQIIQNSAHNDCCYDDNFVSIIRDFFEAN